MLAQRAPLDRVLTNHHFHDLGKLLFAFLMLWAYLTFSQFLIIWSANMPEEIPHYLDRWENGYQYVTHRVVVAALHPALCAAAVARPQARHGAAARDRDLDHGARVVDYYWHVAPEFNKSGLSLEPARRGAAAGARRDLPDAVRFAAAAADRCCRCNDRGPREGAASPCPLSTSNSHDLEYGPTPPGAQHEHTDIDPRDRLQVRHVAGGGDGAVVAAIVYGTFWFFEGQRERPPMWRRSSSRSPSGRSRNRRRRTCRRSRSRTSTCCARARTSKLGSYGWVDKDGGVTRIPIDRAMEVMLATRIPGPRRGRQTALNVVDSGQLRRDGRSVPR